MYSMNFGYMSFSIFIAWSDSILMTKIAVLFMSILVTTSSQILILQLLPCFYVLQFSFICCERVPRSIRSILVVAIFIMSFYFRFYESCRGTRILFCYFIFLFLSACYIYVRWCFYLCTLSNSAFCLLVFLSDVFAYFKNLICHPLLFLLSFFPSDDVIY